MASSQILSLIGWSFVPDFVTRAIQSVWYGITIRAGDPRPQRGQQKYAQHYRRIKILVVSLYLLYTIYEADWEMRRAGDYYQALGVSHLADERTIKSKFRRLAALHHPDKVTASNPSAEGYFLHLKLAQDILMNPVKRFAYDRFGPTITEWRQCASIGDYVTQGFWPTFGTYAVGAVFMYILGIMGYLEWGAYWRWFTMVSLFVFELYTVTRPYSPAIATKFINPILSNFSDHPPYLPFQLITLLRKMAFTLHIAFSQIGPLLQSPELQKQRANPEKVLKESLVKLDNVSAMTAKEAEMLVHLEMAPFAGDKEALRDVQTRIQDWLVNNTIRTDPDVRLALGRVMQRRRVDAPAGARGNR